MRGANSPHTKWKLTLNSKTVLRDQAVVGTISVKGDLTIQVVPQLRLRIYSTIALKGTNLKNNSAHSTLVPDEDPVDAPDRNEPSKDEESPKIHQVRDEIQEPSKSLPGPGLLQSADRLQLVGKKTTPRGILPKHLGLPGNLTERRSSQASKVKPMHTNKILPLKTVPDLPGKIIHRVSLNSISPRRLGNRPSHMQNMGQETCGTKELELGRIPPALSLPINPKEHFNQVLYSRTFDLMKYLPVESHVSQTGLNGIDFSVNLNGKLTPSCTNRLIHMIAPETNFDQERDELVQFNQYKKSKTLGAEHMLSARPLLQSTDYIFEGPIHHRPAGRSTQLVDVETHLELYHGDKLVDSVKVLILENPSVIQDPQEHTIVGSISRKVKQCLCWKKNITTNFTVSVGHTKLSSSKPNMAFKLRSQHALLSKYTYLDVKLQERLTSRGTVISDFTIAGSTVYFRRKFSPIKPHSLEEYFEFVGQISFPKLDLNSFTSVYGDELALTHTIHVYLSDWPLSFQYFVGAVPIEISKLASPEQALESLGFEYAPSFEEDDHKLPKLTLAL